MALHKNRTAQAITPAIALTSAALDVSIFAEKDSLQQFKNLLKLKDIELRKLFNPQQSVSRLLKDKSDFIDKILSPVRA